MNANVVWYLLDELNRHMFASHQLKMLIIYQHWVYSLFLPASSQISVLAGLTTFSAITFFIYAYFLLVFGSYKAQNVWF